jgi:flagellar biosynthesis protein FlhF
MGTKIYRAGSMSEALEQVRRDLGGAAVILDSRERRRRRFFGLGPNREYVEVRAATGLDVPASKRWRGGTLRIDSGESHSATTALHSQVGEQLGKLHAMVSEIARRGRVDHLLPDIPSELVGAYATLVEAEVPEALARRLVRAVAEEASEEDLSDPAALLQALHEVLAASLPIAPPITTLPGKRRVVALVGPTGVGKTTTVAKLAATFKLVHGLKLGLLTVDTYRIAAIEQLRTYAEIIKIPIAVANSPAEMRTALESLGEVDLVLVDTAGRSPRDEVKIRELSDFLSEVKPDEVHLVLSATLGQRSAQSVVSHFAQVRADRLILTKLDEADGLGSILSIIGHANLPLSYLTNGQAVPDDIERADREHLASQILGGDASLFEAG